MSADFHIVCSRSFTAEEQALLRSLLPGGHIEVFDEAAASTAEAKSTLGNALRMWRNAQRTSPFVLVHLSCHARLSEQAVELAFDIASFAGGSVFNEEAKEPLGPVNPLRRESLTEFLFARRSGRGWNETELLAHVGPQSIRLLDDEDSTQVGELTQAESDVLLDVLSDDLDIGIEVLGGGFEQPTASIFLDDDLMQRLADEGVPSTLVAKLQGVLTTRGTITLFWVTGPKERSNTRRS